MRLPCFLLIVINKPPDPNDPNPKIVFRFLNTNLEEFRTTETIKGKPNEFTNPPIEVEKGEFTLAYVAEDFNNSAGNSFIVVLTATNGQHLTPKLIKFE